MKKIIAITAVMAFFGSVASAELLKNFKYDGSIEVNAYNTNNTVDYNKKADDKKGDVDSRVMINASFDLNNDVNAVVSVVKNNRKYGTGSEDANTIQTSMIFEQAYLNLKGVFGMDHKLGRQYYGKAGDLVIYFGPLMWPYDNGMTVNAIDGWTGWYKTGNWDIHAILGNEANSTANPNTDTRLSGINASTKIDRWNLNAYYYNENDKSLGTSNYLGVLGARANWECMFVKGLNLGLEYDMNMGKDTVLATNNEHQGYAYKINADYSMDIMGKLGLEAEYVFASGDDNLTDKKDKEYTSINGDYRPGILVGGGFTTAYAMGSGSLVYGLGANWTPEKLNKLNVAAKYYDFSADKKSALTKKHEGAELDLVATWNHSENVSVKGYYAMFTPEKKNNANDDAATMLGAAFNVKF